ncbi:MAG: 6-phosphogluconolactonase [Parachlamydiales bacterium]|nr:6-phosphogluconolactonase [Parachlamydiales bacterium]
MLNAYMQSWDENKDLVIPGDAKDTITFVFNYLVNICQQSIQDHDFFSVALSGGITPLPLFDKIRQEPMAFNWEKIKIFWSDERVVAPTSAKSNYFQAMNHCFSHVPIPQKNIFPIPTDSDLEIAVKKYQKTIKNILGKSLFDLVLLGLGEDGHTASLFPQAPALLEQKALVTTAQNNSMQRITLTLPCINHSQKACLLILGESKSDIVKKILVDKENLPAQKIGTPDKKALWICDRQAAEKIMRF